MARKVHTHIPSDASEDPGLAPKHLSKQQFGKRLYTLMLRKGWTQSELARRAEMPRDSVSVYIRGRSLPTPQSLLKLAAALDAKPEELLPNHIENAIDDNDPAFELRQAPGAPGQAWLRVNRLVSMPTALKIAELLSNDNAINGN